MSLIIAEMEARKNELSTKTETKEMPVCMTCSGRSDGSWR